jgi:competence protein ComEA
MSRLLRATAAAALLAGAMPALAKKPLGPTERIDLNRASVAELMRLPGVGLKKAQAIVARRSRQPFARPEDVTSVKGLGPAWFAKVKGSLTTGDAAAAAPTVPPGQR